MFFCLDYFIILLYNFFGDNMRIIEKKCPNCGAGLEFDENAKSCKCDYCKRTFEIERENTDKKNLSASDFNLNEFKGPMKVFTSVTVIVSIIMFIIVGSGIIFIGSLVFRSVSSQVNGGELLQNVDQLDNNDYGAFDQEAYHTISSDGSDLDDYHLDMNVNRQKIYIAYKKGNKKEKTKDKNIIIVVYKAKYKKIFNNENTYNLLVPIVYEDLKDDKYGGDSLVFQLDNGSVKAPEYYFNLEHSEYAYGYKDIETLEKDLIKPLKKDGYKISEK